MSQMQSTDRKGRRSKQQPVEEVDPAVLAAEQAKRRDIVETKYKDKVRSKNAFFKFNRQEPATIQELSIIKDEQDRQARGEPSKSGEWF